MAMNGDLLAMPIIVLNMGGEMVYILSQRLQAQNVADEKARKVLEDVVRAMYTPAFLTELYKPQEVYTQVSTKQIFEKLAHSSIMRLNKTSMDKLYDLMTMGVKYQLVSCTSPQQFLQVTLNHLDSVMDMIKSESVVSLVQLAISKSVELYSQLSNGNWLLLQQTLYQFYQGKKIKVSLFLQQNLQTTTGVLVLNSKGSLPYGTEVPGTIRQYEDHKLISTKTFDSPLAEQCYESQDVLDPNSRLGMNMYSKKGSLGADAKGGITMELTGSALEASRAFARSNGGALFGGDTGGRVMRDAGVADSKWAGTPSLGSGRGVGRSLSKESARAELTMLADLLGVSPSEAADSKDAKSAFRIDLFPNSSFVNGERTAKADETTDEGDFIMIDIDAAANNDYKTNMEMYMRDLDLGDASDSKAGSKESGHTRKGGDDDDDDDLLALMDSAK